MIRSEEPLHVLFVCSRNQWRSPTAEKVFGRRGDLLVRSAGLASSARVRLGDAHLAWADIVFVMEESHREQLRERHRAATRGKPVHVLDIPDEYGFMNEELVAILEAAVTPILEGYFDGGAS